ncbi:MAG: MaoC/PaaZ C-terminal domain-containing protein [Myxococcota bacterium]
MELNASKIGKVYEPTFWEVTEENIKKYASGYNDMDNPLFKAGQVAPPMYATRYSAGAMYQPFADQDLNINFQRLVHGEHDIQWLALPKPGDTVRTMTIIHNMEEKSSGELLVVRYESFVGEKMISTILGSFFIRAKKRPGEQKPEGAKAAPPPPPPKPPVLFTQKMYVTNDQTFRYAEGSGDHNPIHVDNDYAIAAGMPGMILQGLCTMAFGTKSVMDLVLDKDAERLKRFAVRFSKPVFPYDILTTEGWLMEEKPGMKVVGLEIKNQNGVVVLANGRAEVAV